MRAFVEAARPEAVTVSVTEVYGPYGGQYVPETLMPALDELERGWSEIRDDPTFTAELAGCSARTSADRRRSTSRSASATARRIYLKREDLCHTGAHKINNAVGQALIARRLGKQRIVAETGAGQHGVASATVCARFGLECVVYMGAEDMERQKPTSSACTSSAPRCARRVRDAHAEGGDQRGDPRLDHERRDDATT